MKIFLFLLGSWLFANGCAQVENQNVHQNNNQTKLNQEIMDTNQNTDPETVVKSLIDAMAANDAEKIRSLFHGNAKQAYGENGSWKSGEAFFKWLKSDIIDRKGHVDDANFSANGNEVVVTGQYSSVGYTNKANFLFSVKDGKIASWQMRY